MMNLYKAIYLDVWKVVRGQNITFVSIVASDELKS